MPEPRPDAFWSDTEEAIYVDCRWRGGALTFGHDQMGVLRSECSVQRVWVRELTGEVALKASGEWDAYYLEVTRKTEGAFPMWKVTASA